MTGTPRGVEIGPGGKIIVAVSAGGQLRVWSASAWQPLTAFIASNDRIPPGPSGFAPPALSPDGNFLAALDYNNQSVTLWNAVTGQNVVVPLTSGTSSSIYSSAVALGPHRLMAIVYSDGSVGLEKENTGQTIATLTYNGGFGSNSFMDTASFSPDGGSIMEGSYAGGIYLWDTADRNATALTVDTRYNNTSDPIDSIAFSADSKVVAGGSESGIVRVWKVSTKRLISTFTVNTANPSGAAARPVRTLVFSPDDKSLLTADHVSGAVSVWDVASGRKIATVTAPTGNVASVAFTAHGALVVATTNSSSSGQDIEIWGTGKSLASVLPGS